MKLGKLIESINGKTSEARPSLPECEVDTFVIDSREVKAGDVFFALSQPEYKNNGFNGEFEDSTAFVRGAFAAGAVACVVRKDRFEEHKAELEEFRDRLIFVDDSIAALQALAHAVYLEWNKPVVAVTGSAGKTTAKELTAHVLASSGRKVLRNIKNFNNGLGHPLTVLRLAKEPDHDVAVLEMGMSTPLHEIARLCRITPPDVAIELNVLPVHLEHLGSIEAIAAAKAELVEGMKPGGTAVLNADDPRVAAMANAAKGNVVTYGIENDAFVRASDIAVKGFGETTFTLAVGAERSKVSFPLNGRHNILNALAAASAGHIFGMSVTELATSLSSVAPPPQRGEILRFTKGFIVVNDSYNSNPDALLSMVSMLCDSAPKAARKIVVAGEMLELGPDAAAIHRRTGEAIASRGIDVLLGVRGFAKELVDGAKTGGIADEIFAADSNVAARALCDMVEAGDVVLVKGSRGVRTEKVIEALLENFELEGDSVAAG
ncbi:MAG: UDP-N-acetylmuramoyl-tripeptide--D-alanyl-D- alanine ligase [Acidobacteria bacterium OLB17]|nr:MAG: UDP-N-acetylmuramoyl-tripeptide--D-alanyl-D- alanine ligase [Acidobacteria bacterium OLB17]MCZ2391893.1 UDP-N-acetylmuramoyl-tripeptide--D-alanyl-D-alanine ligase [Acidobacteriota bacterium]